jgi:diguanylate cyclase (GGDEF)-like protein
MVGKSAKQRPIDGGGRDTRLKLVLLFVALLLVAGYAATLTEIGDMVLNRILAALSVPLPFGPMVGAGIAAAAFLGLVAQALSRRKTPGLAVKSDVTEPLGIHGRAALLDVLQRQIEAHAKIGRQLALHLVDIDDFSDVNRTLGEAEGDAFLRLVAERLLVLVEHNDRLARIGDDEFAIIQPETGGARHAEIYARRIQDTIKDACAQIARHARPRASLGVAVSPDHGDNAGKLLHNASLALQAAKAQGGNTFAVFARDMEMSIDARLQMEKAIDEGLHHGWFFLRYQPQYDLKTRRLRGFEALVRMNHPDMGELEPDAFLPSAEQSGLIQPLGEWIMRDAVTTAAEWPPHVGLALNVSAAQFRGADVAASLLSVQASLRFDPARLTVEVPEAVLFGGSGAEQLRRLRARGVTVVVDDFGVGRSNLQSLAEAPCDAVKLDRSFVKQIGEQPEGENLVRGLIGTAAAFDLIVMAEGVERADQVRFLMSNGCQNVQGYLFGRPVDAPDVGAIIAKDLRNSLESQRAGAKAGEAA